MTVVTHVSNTDPKLTDSRTPTAHNHATSEITGLDTALSNKSDTSHNHTGVYEPADATILKDADIGVSVASQNHNHTGVYAPVLGADDNYVTDAEKTKLANLSGTNSGDNATNTQYSGLATSKQDTLVSGTNIKTVNGNSLLGSGDVSISSAVAWGGVTGTLSNQTDLQTALDGKVDENVAITGATKTKITYDAKGLVTSGADATTADIADSANKRYVTDAQLTVIGNTSGTNTGDNAVNSNYSGLVSNATHTGDATGSTALTVVKIQGKDFPTLGAGDDQKYPKYNNATNAFVMTAIAGGGNVSNTGTPANNQVAVWTDATTVEGDTALTFDTTTDTLATPNITLTGTLTLATGGGTNTPLSLPAGTLKATPADGDIEMDANALYACTDAGNRGIIPVEHLIRLDATRTFTSNTTQQAIFNSPAGGTLTLETGTYLFEGLFAMTSMSATSGNGKFSIIGGGTATLGDILWQAYGNDNAAETTGAATGGSWHVIATETAANVITAAAGTAMCFLVKGTFTVTVAGTIIPSFAQTTAAAAVMSIGSYFKCNRIGSTSVTSIGQWT